MTRTARFRRPLGAGAVLLAALFPLVAPGHAQAATPQLRVAVDNGRGETKAGASSVYTVTVTNLGSSTLKNLRLSQSVPAEARLVSADAHGRVAKGQVTWTVDLPAAGSRSVRTTLKVDERTPDTLLRLATVACVRVTVHGPPLVCAADSDQLPAGAAATRSSTTTPAVAGGGVDGPWAYAAAGVALLSVAGVGAVVARRRRRSLRAAGGVGAPQ